MSRSSPRTTDPRRGEIEASRARLVAAADEARRRLERDLHDGAQQRFVLATVWAQARRRGGRAARPPPSRWSTRRCSNSNRDSPSCATCAPHPPGGAQRARARRRTHRARRPLAVARRAPRNDPACDAPSVEAALYFTVAEALTNVGKHAEATRASVTIDIAERTITAEIADDGIGGAGTGRLRPPRPRRPSVARRPRRHTVDRQPTGRPHHHPRTSAAARRTSGDARARRRCPESGE